jgi:biopolymer transport protein ExbD
LTGASPKFTAALMPFKTSESKLESHLPKDTGPSTQKIDTPIVEKIDIRIKVDKSIPMNARNFEGVSVSINGKKLASFVGLKSRLADIHATLKSDPTKVPVELNADEDVPFYFVIKALDYAKLNNFSTIKFPSKPTLKHGKFPRLNQ